MPNKKNVYELDTREDTNGVSIPALNEKNKNFIEGIIKIDSRYSFDDDINSEPNKKYNGSTAYWFNQMKTGSKKFEDCIFGAIVAIDIANSTHLQASQDGRNVVKDRIIKKCNNVTELKECLEHFDFDDKDNLVSIISDGIKTGDSEKYNISFATKFCFYAAYYLGCKIEFNKYDKVVSDILPQYCKFYLHENVKQNAFKINYSAKQKHKHRLDVYKSYSDCINRIIDAACKQEGFKLTKNEFDHILWYTQK